MLCVICSTSQSYILTSQIHYWFINTAIYRNNRTPPVTIASWSTTVDFGKDDRQWQLTAATRTTADDSQASSWWWIVLVCCLVRWEAAKHCACNCIFLRAVLECWTLRWRPSVYLGDRVRSMGAALYITRLLSKLDDESAENSWVYICNKCYWTHMQL